MPPDLTAAIFWLQNSRTLIRGIAKVASRVGNSASIKSRSSDRQSLSDRRTHSYYRQIAAARPS
jgi:hypothetical protein